MFFKNCTSTNGKCLAPRLCWSKALSLHCYQDNYSWYYLLELGSQEPKLGHFLKKFWSVLVLRAFKMQISVVRWVPGLWGHFTAHEILQSWSTTCPSPSVQADSPCSPVCLQNTSWAVRNRGVLHWGRIQTPKPSRNAKPATWVLGGGTWCQAGAPGDTQEGGQGTDVPTATHQHREVQEHLLELQLRYSIEQPLAAAPIHLAKPFQAHFYFCQGEFTNLIRCIWKDTGFRSF